MAWIKDVLADNDPNVKWKIVYGHHTLYTSGSRKEIDEVQLFRKRMKPIFDAYHVNAYVCGHEHDLEVVKPEGNTYYFISGAGSEVRPIKKPVIPDSRFATATPGFMSFDVTPTEMYVRAIDFNGKELSSFTFSNK